jgi:hypothetical protein
MFRMGECVGTAAAIAVRDGCDFCDINYSKYESRVRALGCFAGDESKSFGFDFPAKSNAYTPVQFNARETLPLLKTETPGVCVWSCYLEKNDNELRELLYSELRSTDDTLYRSNLAIALGIMGDPRSLTTLRETVAQRDDFRFKDCRRSNQLRSAIAVCLLGRLGDESDIKLLSDIAFSESELLLPMYRASECEKNDVYFQMFSHAAASLVKIHKRLALDTTELKNNIDGLIRSKNALHRIAPNADEHAPIYTEILSLLNYLSSQT